MENKLQQTEIAINQSKKRLSFFKDLFLSNRFFAIFGALIALFALSFPFPVLLPIAKAGLILFAIISLVDTFLLFNQKPNITAQRITPKVLSLGDDNLIRIELHNEDGASYNLWDD